MLFEQVCKGGGGVVCSRQGLCHSAASRDTPRSTTLWLGLARDPGTFPPCYVCTCNSVSFFLIMCTVINIDCSFDRIAKRQNFGQSLREILNWAPEVENPTLTMGSPFSGMCSWTEWKGKSQLSTYRYSSVSCLWVQCDWPPTTAAASLPPWWNTPPNIPFLLCVAFYQVFCCSQQWAKWQRRIFVSESPRGFISELS